PGRSLTSTGQIVGTIDYIAPEQIQGKPVDSRTDLYALGCVLYQCLTGVVPFPREETAAFMWAHVHDEPPPVTARRPDLPPQIDHIVAKAIAKQPENRYATCRELALALRAAAADPAASDESGKVSRPAQPIDSPPPLVPAGMTSTYVAPTPAPVRPPVTTSRPGRRWWLLAASAVLALTVIGGSTAAVVNYLSSRFPNEAERTLLGDVPRALTLENSCTRNADAEQDTANVQASVTCTSDGDANTVVFTKFTSAKALDNHYNAAVLAAVTAAGINRDSGDCRSDKQAESAYANESGRTSGRVLCYQHRGSSFITWTEDGPQTLGVATRIDPDYAKLRGWWANAVGLNLPTPEPTQASPPQPPPPAARAAPPAPAPAPPPAPEADPPRPAAPAEEDSRQNQDGRQDQEDGRQEDQPARPPATTPSSPTTTPNSPTTTPSSPTSPPSTSTPPQTPSFTLNGPVPAAPEPQQGGPPVPGTGGCTGTANQTEFYACTVTQTAPVYLPETTDRRGDLSAGPSPFLCQAEGSKYSVGKRANHWWAWVGLGDVGLWAPTVFLAGGPDDAPVPGLPVCGSTPTTTTTAADSTPTTTETTPTTTTDSTPTTTETTPTTTTDDTPTTTETP
ncbi:MAG: serine/threonine protein kinase, partial [Pseudonocardiaceae bacterium]